MSNGDVVSVPFIWLQIRPEVLNSYAHFQIFSLLFLTLIPPVPPTASSWLNLPVPPLIPYALRDSWPLVKPQ